MRMHTMLFYATFVPTQHAARRQLLRVLSASLLLAASAWVAIPVGPVPVTMQTLAVVLLAAVGGRRLAVSATLAYLLEGALGLPVFAKGAMGLPCLVGPTGGYLLGFVGGAFVTGMLRDRLGRGVVGTGLSMLAGHAVILASGAAWLSGFVGVRHAIALGVAPFMLDTFVKVVVGVLLATGVRKAAALRQA